MLDVSNIINILYMALWWR